MNQNIVNSTFSGLETVKRRSKNGGEYWMARDLQSVLGYNTWESFRNVIEKAMTSCKEAGVDFLDHFRETTKMVEVGSGTKRNIQDFFLTRYACYLAAMNGTPEKIEIAIAQRYFAIQTRLKELDDRVKLRDKLKTATKHLNDAAKKAGVQNFQLFAHAGYMGLYQMGLAEIKKRKGIGEKEILFDRAGRLELSANEFRASLAEQSLIKHDVRGETNATREHERIAGLVRDTIYKEIGIYPEDLKAEPPINQLENNRSPGSLLFPAIELEGKSKPNPNQD